MTEIDGYLYALDDTTNSFRYWDKTLEPTSANGGNMWPTPSDEYDDPRWNELYGDIGTSDLNSGIMEYWTGWNLNDPDQLGSVQATELPCEYQVVWITAR